MMMTSGFSSAPSLPTCPTILPMSHEAVTTGASPAPIEDALARMAGLVLSNDRLAVEARSLRRQVEAARSYLAEPGSHQLLGAAQLERLAGRRSATLARLRANRIEGVALLATLGR